MLLAVCDKLQPFRNANKMHCLSAVWKLVYYFGLINRVHNRWSIIHSRNSNKSRDGTVPDTRLMSQHKEVELVLRLTAVTINYVWESLPCMNSSLITHVKAKYRHKYMLILVSYIVPKKRFVEGERMDNANANLFGQQQETKQESCFHLCIFQLCIWLVAVVVQWSHKHELSSIQYSRWTAFSFSFSFSHWSILLKGKLYACPLDESKF